MQETVIECGEKVINNGPPGVWKAIITWSYGKTNF